MGCRLHEHISRQQPIFDAFYVFRKMICLIFALFGSTHHKQADQQSHDIQHDSHIQHILIPHGIDLDAMEVEELPCMVHDPVGHLIAGEACDGPGGKGQAMDGADIAHTVVVGQ